MLVYSQRKGEKEELWVWRVKWTRGESDKRSRWHCFSRWVGQDDPQRSLPTPTILWFCVILVYFNTSGHRQQVSGCFPIQTNQMLVAVWQSLPSTWHPSRLLSACWKYSDIKPVEPEPGMYFCRWGSRTSPRAHFMFLFMYCLKAFSLCPCTMQSLPSKHTNKIKSPPFPSEEGKPQRLCLSSPSTSEHSTLLASVSPANVIFFSLPSPFPRVLWDLLAVFRKSKKASPRQLSTKTTENKALVIFRSHSSTPTWLSAGHSLSWRDEDSQM